MNRQERRKRERAKKKIAKRKKDPITPLEYHQVMNTINAVKMAALLVLRNDGYGAVRIGRFSAEFNEILLDVSEGRVSLVDISDTIEAETGLKYDDLRVK